MRPAIPLALTLLLAGCVADKAPAAEISFGADDGETFEPHVIVGLADSGINPYHALFYRPERTAHPCTYLRDFPCDVKELRLTLGGDDWDAAFEADRETWVALERNAWYWIPQTVFVAVSCDSTAYGPTGGKVPREDICLLDDAEGRTGSIPGHGTGSASIVVQEDPDALLAFLEGGADGGVVSPFGEAGIPVDVMTVSYGPWLPSPRQARPTGEVGCWDGDEFWPIHFHPAGNLGWPILLDCGRSDPRAITVMGGGTAPSRTLNAMSGTMGDITSYFCRPYARWNDTHEVWAPGGLCGTSWASPTAAGGLSKVILELRRASGYDGTLTADGSVDPLLDVSIAELRDAMNLTASYAPAAKHERRPDSVSGRLEVPLNPAAPWLQWGWGFYDGDVANATIAHLLGADGAPEKSAAARAHMEGLWTARTTLYG